MKQILILYIPVLHEGYLKLFRSQQNSADALYILDEEFTEELNPFGKEIRAIKSEVMQKLITSLDFFPVVRVLSRSSFPEISGAKIITADEEISRCFIEKYLPDAPVVFEKIFLRWDQKKVKAAESVNYSRVSTDPFDREMIARAAQEADKSSDWWRHVGAVVVKNGKLLFESHNKHVPSEHMPYAVGDPRDVIESGTMNLLYSSIHAEQEAIARAARDGISLAGTSIYMNFFPCPLCAKLIAYAGIKKCFFKTGSTWLDAESILKAHDVEVILVK